MIRKHMTVAAALMLIVTACGRGGIDVSSTSESEPSLPAAAPEQPKAPVPAADATVPEPDDDAAVPTLEPVPEVEAPVETPAALREGEIPQHLLADEGALEAIFQDFYRPLNSGVLTFDSETTDPAAIAYLTSAIASGARFTATCRVRGFEPAGKSWFTCTETIRDDLYAPIGALFGGSSILSVRDGVVSIERGYAGRSPYGHAWEFLQDFDAWLREGNGEPILVRDDTGAPLLPDTPYPYEAEEAAGYLSLAAEFTSQSNEYPQGGADALAVVDAYYEELASGNWDPTRRLYAGDYPGGLEQAIVFDATFEHECRAVVAEPAMGGGAFVTQVRCDETMHDDFYEPGGLARHAVVVYTVDGDNLDVAGGRSCWAQEPSTLAAQYIYEFQEWRRSRALPPIRSMIEILDTSPVSLPCSLYPFSSVPTEEEVELIEAQLAEFVAASANWPHE